MVNYARSLSDPVATGTAVVYHHASAGDLYGTITYYEETDFGGSYESVRITSTANGQANLATTHIEYTLSYKGVTECQANHTWPKDVAVPPGFDQLRIGFPFTFTAHCVGRRPDYIRTYIAPIKVDHQLGNINYVSDKRSAGTHYVQEGSDAFILYK